MKETIREYNENINTSLRSIQDKGADQNQMRAFLKEHAQYIHDHVQNNQLKTALLREKATQESKKVKIIL